jgi:hypothetical protein
MQGTYHVKNDIPCQDYHHIVKCGEGLCVAAVADGLGSAEHSDVASRIAATLSVNYCAERITQATGADAILGLIKESFAIAQNSIEKEAQANSHSINEYDTTLSLAVLRGDTLYYGHSGDSGIIALTVEGLYEKVTEQQRDEDDRVFPLFFKDKWIFGQHGKKVCSVLLATDGMLETFFPFYIKDAPINIHVILARFFMDNRAIRINEAGEDKVKAQMEDFILNIPDEQVNDDKTIAVLVNASIESSLQPDDYYAEPDWTELKRKHDEQWKRLAYPHLFKEKPADETNITDATQPKQSDVTAEASLRENKQGSFPENAKQPESTHAPAPAEPQRTPTEVKVISTVKRRKGIIERAIDAILGKQ